MRFEGFFFGSVRIDGVSYDRDAVIDRGEVRKQKKRPRRSSVRLSGTPAVARRTDTVEVPPGSRYGVLVPCQ